MPANLMSIHNISVTQRATLDSGYLQPGAD